MSDYIPASQGFRIPPEWHTHGGTLLHWPSNRDTWPGERLERVEQTYLDIIEVLHRYEPVHLLVADHRLHERVVGYLSDRPISKSGVSIHVRPINDVWARDCGPIFVHRSINGKEEFAITDWEYNAWGGKYPPYGDDNQVPAYIAGLFGIKCFRPGMVLEGGAIEVNGKGVLMTTESVLLNPNRNPGMNKQEIEQRLKDFLGIEKIIWLKSGLAGDDTDGHIDDLARFLDDRTILAMRCEHSNDVNYDTLETNLERLREATGPEGEKFRIETLPLPETRIEGTTVDGSEYVPASYANYYVANGVVLVPLYDDPNDRRALGLLEHYFPGREIVGIQSRNLVWGQGSIHCVTQQLYGV